MSNYTVVAPSTLISKKFILGLAEKPSAAKSIAKSLNKGKTPRKNLIKVSELAQKLPEIEVYSCKTDEGWLTVIPALGHLFTLISKTKGSQYPVYDYQWVPVPQVKKNRGRELTKHEARIEATIEAMRYLMKSASEIVIMTDYDIEGEVIGGVICKQLSDEKKYKKVKRMKFSSLTDKDINKAYNKLFNGKFQGINPGLFQRGLMRHSLDWLWGINLSRALMLSLKNTSGRFQILSTGRVQGPTLAFIAEKQKAIDLFLPEPFFNIHAELLYKNETFPLKFAKKIENLSEAENKVKKNKNAKAIVEDVTVRENKIKVPAPYNLSKLQSDAYKYFKFSPKRTMAIAEYLYLNALITYPRTSSEQFSSGMDHKEILNQLFKQKEYSKSIGKILAKPLKPNQGKKSDPAHPAVTPTGQSPKEINRDQKKIYNLIVSKYFATFSTPVIIVNKNYKLKKGELKFSMANSQIKDIGWWEFLKPVGTDYKKDSPALKINQSVNIANLNHEANFTKPPAKYNEASLLKQMENVEIGTKSTRADIIYALIQRKYIEGNPLSLTRLGYIIFQVLYENCPDVLSIELSQEVNKMGELIEERNSKTSKKKAYRLEDAIATGINILHGLIREFKAKENEIGMAITKELSMQSKEIT